MTPFQQATFQQAMKNVIEEKQIAPSVTYGNSNIPYFAYQFSVMVFHLSNMAAGMTTRQVTFTQIKKYYGLKGRSAKECLPQLKELYEQYKQDRIQLN